MNLQSICVNLIRKEDVICALKMYEIIWHSKIINKLFSTAADALSVEKNETLQNCLLGCQLIFSSTTSRTSKGSVQSRTLWMTCWTLFSCTCSEQYSRHIIGQRHATKNASLPTVNFFQVAHDSSHFLIRSRQLDCRGAPEMCSTVTDDIAATSRKNYTTISSNIRIVKLSATVNCL